MRARFALLYCCVVAVSAVPAAAQRHDVDPDRLLQAEAGDCLSFAAGAVRLAPIEGWWVREMARGRDLCLIISPEPTKRLPDDGIWLSYHVARPSNLTVNEELRRQLSGRLKTITSNDAKFSEASEFFIDSWPGIGVEFYDPGAAATRTPLKGRHLLVRTDWGIFELHASAPLNQFVSRSKKWADLWDSIHLEAPSIPEASVVPEARDAATLVGSWKSYRGRMRLRADGTIEIVPDSVNLLVDPNSSRLLRGRYEARGDLLFVTWKDGSRLNLRWRLRASDLLLTDHEGQISQLKRLFE